MAGFPDLMAPGRIGAMPVRNRIPMSPMETMYGTPEGLPSERTRDYLAARENGGVGLITLGATGIDHQHPETPGGLHLATDEAVAAVELDTTMFDALVEAMPGTDVHAAGECTVLGLIRKATEDGARAACAI